MTCFFRHTTILVVLVLAWTALPGYSASGQIVLAPLRGSNAIVSDRPSTHAVDRQTAPETAHARTGRRAHAAGKAPSTGRVEDGTRSHKTIPDAGRAPAFIKTVPLADLSFLPAVSLPALAHRDAGFRVLPLEAERARRPTETEAKRLRLPDERSTYAGMSRVIAHDNKRLQR